MLTLLGLILAIGIVVDDAIVVVENVDRIMNEEHLSPYEATKKAMSNLSGALIAMSLVLCAVFVPVSFLRALRVSSTASSPSPSPCRWSSRPSWR